MECYTGFMPEPKSLLNPHLLALGSLPDEPVQFKVPEKEDIGIEVAPSFTMSKEDGQAFIDELWSAGFRPTEGSGSAGSLVATQAHLKDMRAIVGKQLGVELK